MGNKKKLINKGLLSLFPKEIDKFVDLFAGSGIVSMNVNANKYIINDIDSNLYNFYIMFKNNSNESIINTVIQNIQEFNLRRVSIKNDDINRDEHKQSYLKLRNKANQTKNIIDLYTTCFYAFSQQMRFNSKGEFNMPCGNNAFTLENELNIKNGTDFFSKNNVHISNNDFRKLNISKLNKNDFVYLDPPYFNTTATYNENGGWTNKDDEDLFKSCELLHSKNIKWGMSNVFKCKDKINQHLIDWCNDNNWKVYTFDKFTYMACGKGNSNAEEVFITNY